MRSRQCSFLNEFVVLIRRVSKWYVFLHTNPFFVEQMVIFMIIGTFEWMQDDQQSWLKIGGQTDRTYS